MKEIQAVKTAKIEEVKKNSKKGFTLVELVVVIAILAILAAIAIPVVASTIKSSQVSSANSNAQTIELAVKEAAAAISSGDDSVFNGASSASYLKISKVADDKKITSSISATYKISGNTYEAYFNNSDAKVYYARTASSKYYSVDNDKEITTATDSNMVKLSDTNAVVDASCTVSINANAGGNTGDDQT